MIETVYVASSFSNIPAVREVMHLLERNGFKVAYDWTRCPDTGADYLETPPGPMTPFRARRVANAEVEAVMAAQACIYLCHPEGYGAMFEVGLAYGTGALVIVVAPERRDSLFFVADEVLRAPTALEAVETLLAHNRDEAEPVGPEDREPKSWEEDEMRGDR